MEVESAPSSSKKTTDSTAPPPPPPPQSREVESAPSSSKKTTDSTAPPPPPPPPPQSSRKKRRRNICLVVIAVILGLILLMVILKFTVFKAKDPVTTINSVALKDLDFELNIAKLGVYLNVTLDVNISVKNPNKVGFKYKNSSAVLNYRGRVVGEVPIPASKISPGQTVTMNLTLTILADRLISNSNLFSDIISGTLHLSAFTRISGKVYILKIIKIHVVSYTTCDIKIAILKRSVTKQTCQYKTKL